MSKPDKYPYIDPMQPGVFDAILRTVNNLRKERKSETYRLEQQRIAQAEKTRHDARELERKRAEAERITAQRYASAMAAGFIPVERLPLRQEPDDTVMRESPDPKFVR